MFVLANRIKYRGSVIAGGVAVSLLLAGCGTRVVDGGSPSRISPAVIPSGPVAGAPTVAIPRVAENPQAQTNNVPRVPASSVVDLPPDAERSEYHEVKSGDTLYGIAQRYGISSRELVEANGLDNPASIQPGQLIYIPQRR